MRSFFSDQKVWPLIFGFSMLLGQGCGSPPEQESSETKAAIDISKELALGAGFDRLTGRRRGDCVTSIQENAAAGASHGSVDIVESSEDLQQSLDVDAEVSVGFGPFSASAKSKYLKESQFKQNTLFVVIKSHRETQPTQLTSVRLHPDYAKIFERSPEEFRAACGDTFVKSISKGAELTGILEVSYSSQSDKELIKGSLQAGFAFASAKVSVASQTSSLLENRQVRFRYFAEGSDMPIGAADSVAGMTKIFNDFNQSVNQPNADRNFVPIRFSVIDYEILPLPTPQRAVSRKPFMDKADSLAHDWLKANDCSNKAQYAMNNPSEFENFDMNGMVKLRDASTLAKSKVDAAIDSCFNPVCGNGSCTAAACNLLPTTVTEAVYSCSSKLPKPLPIQDAVYNKWRKFGGEKGELGKLQKSNEKYGNNALLFTFERGSIVYSFNPQDNDQGGSILGKTYAVMGDIRDKWMTLGGAFGRLGYPISDSLKDGQRAIYSIFQSGVVMSVTPLSNGPTPGPARTMAVHSNRMLYLTTNPTSNIVTFSAQNDYPQADETYSNGIGLIVRESGRPYVAGPDLVSHYVNGELYKRYLALGGPASWLGVPLGSEYYAGNFAGYDVWRMNFDRASMVAVVGLGTFVTGGAIRVKSDALGYAALGVPTMDDSCFHAVNGEWGCYTQYAGGSLKNAAITWTEAAGTVVLYGAVKDAWTRNGGAGGLGWPNAFSSWSTGLPTPINYTDVYFPGRMIRCAFNDINHCSLY